MGRMMNDQAKFTVKIAEYQKILSQDCKSLVFIPLAGCFFKNGLLDDALETALKGTWELPDYAPGFVAVARIYAHRKVHQKAVSAFQKALDIDPSCLDAYKGIARIYHGQGDIDAAANLLTKAVALFPEESSLKQMLVSLASASAPSAPAVPTPAQGQGAMEPITTATIAEIYIKQGLYDKALEVYRELFTETQDPSVAKKIAEIEAMAQRSIPQPAPEVSAPEVVSSSVAGQASATSESGVMSAKSVLDNLNSMLASIQARRNRV